jgi:hypothetical protein
MLFQALQIAGDRFFDIDLGLILSRPLGNATRQGRTMGHKDAILIRFDDNTEFHKTSNVSKFGVIILVIKAIEELLLKILTISLLLGCAHPPSHALLYFYVLLSIVLV